MATQTRLRGRDQELSMLGRLLEAVREGESGALVLWGDPGVGKSALLEHAIDSAPDLRLARAVGVESEMELAYAALQQLCAPLLDRLDRLPGPQRDALATAFGLSAGEAPTRFLVGLAAMSLLSDAAEEQPLLCVVDDAQWLDRASAQTLAFAARRLFAEPVGMLFATREPSDDFTGLPELRVEGLRDGEAHELLGSAIHGPLDERVSELIVAETRGNPLALLELPRGLTPAEFAGGFGLPGALPLSRRIEESFRRRLAPLPESTRQLLLVAAAEPAGEPLLVWRAAEQLGIGTEAAAPAESDGLLSVGARVNFRHPLVRSAVYRAASPQERRTVHGALADATDPEIDPDRRAWHRAQAVVRPDEDVAGELERSASRAQARGGLAAAAAFLRRAAALTPDRRRRANRTLGAARAEHDAGSPVRASELLTALEDETLDDLQRAQLERLRAQIDFSVRRGSDVPALFLKAAQRLTPLDARLARETYLEALDAASYTGGVALLEAAALARAAPPPNDPAHPANRMLEGLTDVYTGRRAAGVPALKEALRVFGEQPDVHWLGLAARVAAELWEDQAMDNLADLHVQMTRDAGALAMLPLALNARAGFHMLAGEFADAADVIDEISELTQAVGNATVVLHASGTLAAWRGHESETVHFTEAAVSDASLRGDERVRTVAAYATALLGNSTSQYPRALAAARRVAERDEFILGGHVLSEVVEAAVRSGEPELAVGAAARLAERARLTGTDWAAGMAAYSRALVSEGDRADELYREAIDRLRRCRVRVYLARAHLVYGEWLRRERRRGEAREQLHTAHEMLSAMGADGFAARAERELSATGERARARSADTLDQLTVQEARIARLAGDGLSNPEIGSRLFVSPRTVEYHLHKVFGKFGISSRNELSGVLASDPGTARAADGA